MPRVVVLLASLLIAACEPAAGPANGQTATIRIDQRMGAAPDPGFARARQPRAFAFPADHGPHPAYATEWWYLTGNLRDDDGRAFGYQLTLFRIGLKPGAPPDDSDWRAQQLYMGHLAVSDLETGRHHSAERFARAAAGLAGAQPDPLVVWLGPWSIRGAVDTSFPLRLAATEPGLAVTLTVERGTGPLVLQGDQGLSRKGALTGNASYYYSLTRLPTHGEIRLANRVFHVRGNSWFDREWSSSALAADQAGWDWFALQLDDGRDLMFYRMRGKDGRAQAFSQGVLIGPGDEMHRLSLDDVTTTPIRLWRAGDGVTYPVGWRLQVPRHDLDLLIEAAFDDQEMRQTVRYWEGAVRVSGSETGVGYLELSGYAD